MLSLAEDTSGLVKESAIAMHLLLQKQNTLYKWLISGRGFDKEEFKEVWFSSKRLLTKKSLRKLVRKSKTIRDAKGIHSIPKKHREE